MLSCGSEVASSLSSGDGAAESLVKRQTEGRERGGRQSRANSRAPGSVAFLSLSWRSPSVLGDCEGACVAALSLCARPLLTLCHSAWQWPSEPRWEGGPRFALARGLVHIRLTVLRFVYLYVLCSTHCLYLQCKNKSSGGSADVKIDIFMWEGFKKITLFLYCNFK